MSKRRGVRVRQVRQRQRQNNAAGGANASGSADTPGQPAPRQSPGQQQLSPASRCRAARAVRLSRRRNVRPRHVTAMYAARQAAAQAAAPSEQQRLNNAAVARARAAPLHNLGKQPLQDGVSQHRRLRNMTDPHTGRLSIGLMRHICSHCGAKHFLAEKTGGRSARPVFNNCCQKGKVQLPPVTPYPAYWNLMLNKQDAIGKHFRSYARRYNQVLSMASTGACSCSSYSFLFMLSMY